MRHRSKHPVAVSSAVIALSHNGTTIRFNQKTGAGPSRDLRIAAQEFLDA